MLRRLVFALVAGLVFAAGSATIAATHVVVLVRHAEKGTAPADDPPLTPAGRARAEALAAALGDAGVTHVITTQLRRSVETAGPLVRSLGIVPEVVPVARGETAAHVAAVAAAVRRGAPGVTLVVGHSNTVCAIIAELGGPSMPELPETEFDNLFVLILDDEARLVRLHYGAPDTE